MTVILHNIIFITIAIWVRVRVRDTRDADITRQGLWSGDDLNAVVPISL